MIVRYTAVQRKAMIMAEAAEMVREGIEVTCTKLAKRCKCTRGTIIYHFGGIDEVKRRTTAEAS